jgi:DNA invertase Pin-like site-specific DNA recombinase
LAPSEIENENALLETALMSNVRAAVEQFAQTYGYRIEDAVGFSEVETGKGADALERRPELAAAIKRARQLGNGGSRKAAPVIVAKLDRLSRDVHFILGLMTQLNRLTLALYSRTMRRLSSLRQSRYSLTLELPHIQFRFAG